MKFRLLVALFAACALVTGCEDKKDGDDDKKEDDGDKKKDKKKGKDKKGDKDDGDSGADMPKACKEYMDAWKECAGNLPDAAKPAMEQAYKAWEDSMKAATTKEAKAAMEDGCKQSVKALKDNPACK